MGNLGSSQALHDPNPLVGEVEDCCAILKSCLQVHIDGRAIDPFHHKDWIPVRSDEDSFSIVLKVGECGDGNRV
jgi:hypothetical protein